MPASAARGGHGVPHHHQLLRRCVVAAHQVRRARRRWVSRVNVGAGDAGVAEVVLQAPRVARDCRAGLHARSTTTHHVPGKRVCPASPTLWQPARAARGLTTKRPTQQQGTRASAATQPEASGSPHATPAAQPRAARTWASKSYIWDGMSNVSLIMKVPLPLRLANVSTKSMNATLAPGATPARPRPQHTAKHLIRARRGTQPRRHWAQPAPPVQPPLARQSAARSAPVAMSGCVSGSVP